MYRTTAIFLVLGSLLPVACRPVDTPPKLAPRNSVSSANGNEKANVAPAAITFPRRPKVDVAAVAARYRQPLFEEKEAFLAAIAGSGGVGYDSRGRIITVRCENATDADLQLFAELKELEGLHIGGDGFEKPIVGRAAAPTVTDGGLAPLVKISKLRKLELFDSEISDEGLKTIGQLTGLESLGLESPNITGPGMANLDALKNLRSLVVAGNRVGDSGLRSIAGHAALRELYLDTEVTPRGLAELVRLNVLEDLGIWRRPLNDGDLLPIGKITSLTSLRYQLKGVTNEGLRHMRKLSRLTLLDLSFAKATDADMEYVGEMTGLEYLTLNSYVGDAGVAKLRGLTKLKELDLNNSKITDASFSSLTALQQLRRLNLAKTRVTAAGVARLQGMKNLEYINLYETGISDEERSKLQRSGIPAD